MLEGVRFDPQSILNIYRILQEAVSNIIRHADAKNVSVTIERRAQPDLLRIKIRDDGKGLPAQDKAGAGHPGKGLNNMAMRARQLPGEIDICNNQDGPGVSITLSIPLPEDDQDAPGLSSHPS